MKQRKIIKAVGKSITGMARKAAEVDANTACPWIGFQSELPKSVKKLRKF